LLELTPTVCEDYLRARGLRPRAITELGGGVSNTVLMVEHEGGRLVLKQSLERLRVREEWLSDRDRVFRESRALRELASFFPPSSLPGVLWDDRENYLFAMEAAPEDAQPWKSLLLAGTVLPETAATAGRMLRAMISAGLDRPAWAASFGGEAVFDQLRLDPYYRFTASRHQDLAPRLLGLVEAAMGRRVSLVHGDWSPKNLLVYGAQVMAIDFEVLHFGDPGFDTAFLLNHLLLKSFHRPGCGARYREAAQAFWRAVCGRPEWLGQSTLEHLGGLLLARVDGKSPVEYLEAEDEKSRVRAYAVSMLLETPKDMEELWERWPV
jgi:5-methylthioribose kinase